MLSGLLALEKEYPCNEEQRLERLNSYWPTCGTAGDGHTCQDHREDCHYCPARQGSRWAHRWEGNCTTKASLTIANSWSLLRLLSIESVMPSPYFKIMTFPL